MYRIEERNTQILTVKIGGGAGLDMDRCARDVAHMAHARPLIVVHGVSAMMDRLCAERDIPVRTLTSPSGHESRYTDPQTRDVFVEAAAQVNRELVQRLRAQGINAVGVDDLGVCVRGERKAAIRAMVNGRRVMVRDDYSGSINGVDVDALHQALAQGQTPVLPPVALSETDGALNVDGDRLGAQVAGAMQAADFVILSNVRGLYRDHRDESSLVPQVTVQELPRALDWAQGRMKRKVLGASEALEHGVRRVVIAPGEGDAPLSAALSGAGTQFIA